MQDAAPSPAPAQADQSNRRWIGLGVLVAITAILVIGKFSGLFDPVAMGESLGRDLRTFADGPFGFPAIVLVFCVGAYLAAPQFILIGIAVVAFGPWLGSLYSWLATLISGTLTYGVGHWSGAAVLGRVSQGRMARFSAFVSRNAFLASAVVRNVTAGPFVFVNTIFGALRANFWAYLGGMAVGIVPKIALIAFAGKGIRAAFEGKETLAAVMAAAALAILGGTWWYVRQRRRKGENIALKGAEPVDIAAPGSHE